MLLQRARAMALSIEEPRPRNSWDKPDIDAIGEAALLLYEKGLSHLNPGSSIDLEWEALFCKISISLLFWRGNFLTCWTVCERLCKLEAKLQKADQYAIALARSAGAASYYARYEASNVINRDSAYARAEKLFVRSLEIAAKQPESTTQFCGMNPKAYALYEAARHWYGVGLRGIAAQSFNNAIRCSPEACSRSSLAKEAPDFWKDLYLGADWVEFSQSILLSHGIHPQDS